MNRPVHDFQNTSGTQVATSLLIGNHKLHVDAHCTALCHFMVYFMAETCKKIP